ncbi:hypothetical protein ACHAQA_003784 [Verticillium albo-atrum]
MADQTPERGQGFTPTTIERTAPMPYRPLIVVPYDPLWPEMYLISAFLIASNMYPHLQTIDHVGSTSVPGLAAKPVIDIDVTVADPSVEEDYVPALVKLGFTLVMRQPAWHGARMLTHELRGAAVNLHVFPAGCEEVERHRALRDWLRSSEAVADRFRYARAKREAAAESCRLGESGSQYNVRKSGVLREILRKACDVKGVRFEQD